MKPRKSHSSEIKELKARLAEAEELLSAIKSGSVDAFVTDDQRVFTLKGSDYAYRVLIETLNEGAATLSYDGTVMYCNRQLARLLGKPTEKIVGSSILDFVIPIEVPKFKNVLKISKNKTARTEFQFKGNDKKIIPVLVSCNSLELDTKCLCIIITDLSEQKNYEIELKRHRDNLEEIVKERTKELEESEEKFRNITESSQVQISVTRLTDGVVVFTNAAFDNAYGYPAGELIGKKSAVFYQDFGDRKKIVGELKKNNFLDNYEVRVRRKDGTLFWTSVSVRIINYGGEKAILNTAIDITKRKQIETLLRKNEALLRALTDNSPDAIYVKDTHSRWLMANPAVLHIVGKSAQEALGRTDLELYADPEIGRAILKNDRSILKKGEAGVFEEAADTPEGRRIFLSTKAPWRDAQGDIIGLIGISRDITERKKLDILLQAKSEEQQTILDTTPALIFYKDKENRCLRVNKAFEAAMGISREKLEGKSLYEIFPKEEADAYWKDDLEVIKSGKAKRGIIEPVKTSRGIRIVETDKIPYIDESGKVSGVIGFSVDITERKRAEEALRESEEKYRSLVETPNSIIMSADGNLNITFMNEYGLRFFGYTADELIGKPVIGMTIPYKDGEGHDLAKMCEEMVKNPESFKANVHQNMRKNGELVWVSWTNKLIFDESGKLIEILAIGNDIAKLKEAEDVLKRDKDAFECLVQERTKQLIDAQAELERAKRLSDIGVLAATVAHELRNPLAAIGMAAHNVRRKACNPDLDKHLANIDKKIAESDQIINNLLFYSRLKPPDFERVKIFHLLEEIIGFSEEERRKNVLISGDINSLKDVSLEMDIIQMKEVFHNILNNAYDAIPQEKGEIRISSEIDDEHITISIEDNGPGIGQDIVDKIFDPFFTTKAKGTGLGLSVCRQIVVMHGGEIGVKQSFAKGTCIFVRLPKERASGHPI